jgi:predicted nucleic acid-binding protein
VPVVVADAGPLHYLVLIDAIGLLPRLFGTVVVPDLVRAELSRPRTPDLVRTWLASGPPWLEVRSVPAPSAPLPPKLGEGEREAIALAHAIGAELILMDDRAGVAVARSQGLEATGTLGVLARAAARKLVDLPPAVERLKATNFRCSPTLLDALLAREREQRSGP